MSDSYPITLIAAVSSNNTIGINGGLPWSIPEDLKFFRQRTLRKPVILGRKTWDSFKGDPLPHRDHYVVTKRPEYTEKKNVNYSTSFQYAVETIKRRYSSCEIMVIGGGEIYKAALPYASKIILTRIHDYYEGDTFFPSIDKTSFKCDSVEWLSTTSKIPCSIEQYSRISDKKTLRNRISQLLS